jgi:DNA mismatch repair protein MutL
MSSIIQLLPDHVANQIAAGEVVQRPASVVKELLENAVDAKGTQITLVLKDAGKTLVQVIDNGVGMNAQDAQLCFARHATSKIKVAEDLFALNTKGFRGEALASIAAIAHVELKTKQEQDELGTHVVIEGSKFIQQEPAVLPQGTNFIVKNLFFNIPARRNFLKSDSVELRHVVDEFIRVALAHPNIQFAMYHNNNEVYNLPASNQRQRIVNLFTGKTNEKLVPIAETTEIVSLQGFVGKPEFAKKNKGEQFFFVNNRYVKSGYLHHAVMAAYEGLLKEGMQPSYFLYLEVPAHSIDINIHPTKTEIKFDDEQALYAILRSAVKHSLGQFNVAPVLDFDRDPNLDTPYDFINKTAEYPTIQFDSTFNPFANDDETPAKTSRSSAGGSYKRETVQPAWESLYVGLKDDYKDVTELEVMDEEAVTSSLFDEVDDEHEAKGTYQIHKKYIVSPIKSGIVIINQKRAHQRVLYEEYLGNITTNHADSQQLLFPLELFFSAQELAMLKEMQHTLEHLGFVFSAYSPQSVVISGLPVTVTERTAQGILEDMFAQLQQGIEGNAYSQNDTIAKLMAKNLAVKTGAYLNPKEQENLVHNLFACKEPTISPFNKPTFITMSVDDLDKKFSL